MRKFAAILAMVGCLALSSACTTDSKPDTPVNPSVVAQQKEAAQKKESDRKDPKLNWVTIEDRQDDYSNVVIKIKCDHGNLLYRSLVQLGWSITLSPKDPLCQ